jgi:hypothetical protein
MHSHEGVAPALLARFDDRSLQAFQLGFTRMNHGSLGFQRKKICRAEFGQLFNEEIAAVAFGHRRGYQDRPIHLATGRFDTQHMSNNRLAIDLHYFGWILVAIAIEERNPFTVANSANMGKMVKLVAFEGELSDVERKTGVKPIGHLW